MSVGKQKAGSPQHHDLHRVLAVEGITHRRNDSRSDAIVVERDFVLVFALIAVDQAARDFGKQLWVAHQAVPLLANVGVGCGLSKRVAKQRQTAKAIARYVAIDGP